MQVTMRNLVLTAVAALALTASSAWAGPIGNTGQFNQTRLTGYFSGTGGEFTVYGFGTGLNTTGYSAQTRNQDLPGNPVTSPSFQTFCIESTEFTGGDPTYYRINSGAVNGGASGGNPDPISKGTAWLYSQFSIGTLAGFTYTPGAGRAASALALQEALWYLEGETGGVNNAFVTAASNAVGAANLTANAAVGEYGVYVLNTYSTNTNGVLSGRRQDFLYRVPDGGTTVTLLGGVLLGIGALRRRYAI